MKEKIIIRLPQTAEQPVHWLIADYFAATVIASGQLADISELTELSEKSQNREVYVAVAGAAVTMHLATVPTRSRRHLQQLIPYALEDEVAEEIEQLHFAWPTAVFLDSAEHKTAKQDVIPVAVVARQQMQLWLSALAAANIAVNQLIPDYLLLPVVAEGWSVACFQQNYILRQGQWQGASFELAWLPHLDALLGENAAAQVKEIVTLGELEWPEQTVLPAPVRALAVDLPLLTLLQNWPQQTLNLCQGEFTQQQEHKVSWQQFRWPAMAASILVGIYLAYLSVTWLQLERETALVQQAIKTRYAELFPAQPTYSLDARRRIEQQLALLTDGAQGEFLSLVTALVPAFQHAELEITLLQFERSRNELRLQATGQNFQAFERFQQAARQQALEVEQGQLVNRTDRIAGTLIIRRAL